MSKKNLTKDDPSLSILQNCEGGLWWWLFHWLTYSKQFIGTIWFTKKQKKWQKIKLGESRIILTRSSSCLCNLSSPTHLMESAQLKIKHCSQEKTTPQTMWKLICDKHFLRTVAYKWTLATDGQGMHFLSLVSSQHMQVKQESTGSGAFILKVERHKSTGSVGLSF